MVATSAKARAATRRLGVEPASRSRSRLSVPIDGGRAGAAGSHRPTANPCGERALAESAHSAGDVADVGRPRPCGPSESLDARTRLGTQLHQLDEAAGLARGCDDLEFAVLVRQQDGGGGRVEELAAGVDEHLQQVDHVVVVDERVGERRERLQQRRPRVSARPWSGDLDPARSAPDPLGSAQTSAVDDVLRDVHHRSLGRERVALDHEPGVVRSEIELREHEAGGLVDEPTGVGVPRVVVVARRGC